MLMKLTPEFRSNCEAVENVVQSRKQPEKRIFKDHVSIITVLFFNVTFY